MHFLIPVLIVLAVFPKLNKKLVFGLSFLTIFPDFDFIFDHRGLFHNVFFIALFALGLYFLFHRQINVFLLSLFYLGSHLILDFDDFGSALFYPISRKTISFSFGVVVDPLTKHISIIAKEISRNVSEAKFVPGHLVSTEGILMFSLVLIAVITFLIIKKNGTRKKNTKK